MKRLWLFVFIFAVLFLSANYVQSAPVVQIQSGDGIWIMNGSTYDFPATSVQEIVSRGFTVYNDGASALTISNTGSLITGAGFSQHPNVVLASTINPGASSAFRILFSHSSSGDYSGTVRLQTNAGIFQFTIRANVRPSPYSSIRIVCGDGTPISNGGTYNFPPAELNELVARGFTVYNDGTASLSISNPTSVLQSAGKFSQHPNVILSSSIPAGDNSAFRILFQSAEPGLFSAVVSIQTNDSDDNPFRFTLTAQANPPAFPEIGVVTSDGTQITKNSTVLLPNTTTGHPIERMFTIVNSGSAPLSIDNPGTLIGGSNFVQTGQLSQTISQGGQSSFTVRFVSNTAGTFTGTVTIQSNDPDDDPFVFFVRTTVNNAGVSAISVVAGDGTVITNGGVYNYPDTPAGFATGRAFTVSNTGTASLHIYNPTSLVTGNGFVQLPNVVLSPDIEPGGSSVFRIRLLSSTPATYTALVRIESNDPDDTPFTFTVTGRVVAPKPSIRVVVGDGTVLTHGGQYQFPPVGKNTLISRGFTVYNDGNAALQISNTGNLVTGQNFLQHPNVLLAPTIEPDSSSAFRVQFEASSSGSYNATVTIHSNDPQIPSYTVTLVAEIREPDFTLKATPASRTILQGESAEYQVAFDSSYGFNSPVSLSIVGLPNAATPVFNPQTIMPGQTSTLTIQTSTSTPAVNRTLDLIGTSGAIHKQANVRLRIEALELKPSITSTEPRYIPQESNTILTLTGVNLQNAVAEIGTAKRSADDEERIYPAAQILSISPDGTEMHVQINASDPRILGFYALYITTPGGRYGTGFRVIPDSPVVDFWTPSEVANGHLYALDLIGINLQGAKVIPNNPGIEIMDIDNSDDEYLTGYIVSSTGTGPLSLTVRGTNGKETLVHFQARPKMGQVVRETKTLLSASDGSPVLFYQPPVSSAHMKSSGFNKIEDKSLIDWDICFNWSWSRSRGRVFSKTLFKSPVDNVWRPVIDSVLGQLQPGVSTLLQTQTFTRWFFFSIEVNFRTCISNDNADYINFDFSICATLEAGFNIPIIGGFVISGELCNDHQSFDITGTGFLSFIQFHKYNSSGGTTQPLDCVNFNDVTAIPGSGERNFEVNLNQCCSEEIGVSYEGDFYISNIRVDNQRAGQASPHDQQCPDSDKIKVAAFIPFDHVNNPTQPCIPGFRPAPIYIGDDRGFSPTTRSSDSRLQQIINLHGNMTGTTVGETRSYATNAVDDGAITAADDDSQLLDCSLLNGTGRAQISPELNVIEQLPYNGGKGYTYRLRAGAGNPITNNPADESTILINWDLFVTVDHDTHPPVYVISGKHDCFPGYEIWINDKFVYGFTPPDITRMTPLQATQVIFNCLTEPMEVNVQCDGRLGDGGCRRRSRLQAVNDNFHAAEDKPASIPILSNDIQPYEETVLIESLTQPAHGAVAAGANGTVTYSPAANYSGPDSFSYTITDGETESSATVDVMVDSMNDAPAAISDSATTRKGIAVTIPVLANDVDPEAQQLTLVSVSNAAHGTAVKNANATITYRPVDNYSGPDTFTYIISDGLLQSTGTVNVTIQNLNSPPAAGNDSATTNQNTRIAINVLANDSDPDAHQLMVSAVTQPRYGTAQIANGQIVFTPKNNHSGKVQFNYTVTDHNGGQTTATITVHVNVVTGEQVVAYGVASDLPLTGDWNGDGKDEVGVFRNGTFFLGSAGSFGYGIAGDLPVAGDFDGDGADEVGVFRSGTFYLKSDSNYPGEVFAFGPAGGKPVTGDWDGDGKDEVGVFYFGTWYLRGNGAYPGETFAFGQGNGLPLAGDWDGNGKAEPGIFYFGTFTLRDLTVPGGQVYVNFGQNGDKPIAGNWTGSTNDSIGYVRGNNFTMRHGPIGGYLQFAHGLATDKPVIGDFDGNGASDVGLFRSGTFILPGQTYAFGPSDGWPFAADWDADGKDNAGVFRFGFVYLKGGATSQDQNFYFGDIQGKPFAGDFNGDGKDETGVISNGWSQGSRYDIRANAPYPGASFYFGTAQALPIAGDWDGDGKSEAGAWSDGTFTLKGNDAGTWPGKTINFGQTGDTPLAGDWTGIGSFSIGYKSGNIYVLRISVLGN